MYRAMLKDVLTKPEKSIFDMLNSPAKIQNFLDRLPVNFEEHGETYMSPRRVLSAKTAHCFEGALLAAAALAYHGERPLIMDLKTIGIDEDHVIALFKKDGYWGAISKTNHAVLRYRDPVYATVRELVMSYFHEYILDGQKTLRSYSKPFTLSRFDPQRWVTAEDDLVEFVDMLDDSPHTSLLTKKQIHALRKASTFEINTTAATEWKYSARKRSTVRVNS